MSVPPTVNVAEDELSVEVCATLDEAVLSDLVITLTTDDDTGENCCLMT